MTQEFWPLHGDYVELHFIDERSNKFWSKYDLRDPYGRNVTVYNWGKIGAGGQYKVAAGIDYTAKVDEKRRKGYEQVEAQTGRDYSESVFPSVVREQIEAALIQNGRSRGRGVVETEPEPVNLFDQAQALVQKTITQASTGGDDAEAVLLHHELSSKVAELRAELDRVEAGAEVAEAAVRAKWDS